MSTGNATIRRENIVDDAIGVDEIEDDVITFAKIDSDDIATQVEAEAGTSSNTLMTPERTKEAIDALAPSVQLASETDDGNVELSTLAEQGSATETGGSGAALVPQNKNIVKVHATYTPAYLTGGSSAESNVALWDSVSNGSYRITIDGTSYNIDGQDFTATGPLGIVTSMAEVASVLQYYIRESTGLTETVVWSTDHFVWTSADTTSSSEVSVTSTSSGTVGTDISGAGASDWLDADGGQGTATAAVLDITQDENKLLALGSTGDVDPDLLPIATQATAEAMATNDELITPLNARGAAGTALTRTVYDTVTQGKALALEKKLDDDSLAVSEYDLGNVSTAEKFSFRVIGGGVSFSSMKLKLGKTGTPTDNLVVRIETDNSGEPSGTLVHANATANVSGAGLTTSQVVTTATFAGSFTLVDGIPYHVVMSRSTAVDGTNYYNVSGINNTVKVHLGQYYNGSIWQDRGATFYFEEITAGSFGTGLAMADSDSTYWDNFDSFANEAGVDGEDILIVNDGIMSGFTGLITGRTYYLGTTTGSITLTNTGIIVGVAISSTELIIKKSPRYATGSINRAQASGTGTEVATMDFAPSLIVLHFTYTDGSTGVVFGSGSAKSTSDERSINHWTNPTTTARINVSTSYIAEHDASSANRWRGNITAINETGFSLLLSLTGTPGTFYSTYECFE